MVHDTQDGQINSLRESNLDTINQELNERRADCSNITCLKISQRQSPNPNSSTSTNRLRLYVSPQEKGGLHPFESQHQDLTIPNLTFGLETESSLSSVSLGTKLEKCETITSRVDFKRHPVRSEDDLIEHGNQEDQLSEDGTLFCLSDSDSFQDETSNEPSDSSLLTSCTERSMISQKGEESNVFKSKPTFGHNPRTVSFRHFYYRPMIIKGPKPGEWYRVSNVHSNVRFLRKARYLEKLVKDYDLDTMIPSPRPASCLSSELGRDGEERSSGELASREGKASNVSVADRDGVCLCEKYCSLLYQEKPLESISATGEDTSPTTYPCTSNATGNALLDKRKRKSEARRFSKLASVWPGIKHSFLGSLIRRISSLSGRGRKEQNLESSCASQSSVSETCMSLSEASLVQPTRSDLHVQAPSCCGELDTDPIHAAHSKSTLRDQNRSAQTASHPISKSTDVDTAEEMFTSSVDGGSQGVDGIRDGSGFGSLADYPMRPSEAPTKTFRESHVSSGAGS